MFLEFSVKNFRSIKELQTISFVATKLDSNAEKYADVDLNNIATEGTHRILKTIGIYGPNASGKSNILRALEVFCNAIRELPSPESRLSELAQPYLFQDNAEETESYFQIVVLYEEKKYRYGFTVKKNLSPSDDRDSKHIITNEWLYGPKETNQTNYFLRSDKAVDKDRLPNNKNIPDVPHKHTLFLTHAASFEEGICFLLRNYIAGYTVSNFTRVSDFFRRMTVDLLDKEDTKKELLSFLSAFQLEYIDIRAEKAETDNKTSIPQEKIHLTKRFGEKDIRLNLKNNESQGTKKLFDLAGLFLRAFNLKIGGLIILDELDSNFHPFLVMKLIEIFNTPSINKTNFQLLFTSHNTTLLNPSILRRDQIYFTEKVNQEATKLYSLADLKGIRNDADFAKQYLAGFYGALPILDTYFSDNANGALEPQN